MRRLSILLRSQSTTTTPYIRPRLIMPSFARSPPSSPGSAAGQDRKRAKVDTAETGPANVVPTTSDEAGPSSKVATAIMEAPVNAMFAPQRTKAAIKKSQRMAHAAPERYSTNEVLWLDIRDFLGAEWVDQVLGHEDGRQWEAPESLKVGDEITLRVGAFTVAGESLSLYHPEGSEKKWAVVTPFAHPGDLIKVRVTAHGRLHSTADLLEIMEYDETHRGGPGDRRKFPEGGCKYFGVCGGCQFQPMPYSHQLLHKKKTVELAYSRYSQLSPDVLPVIQDTIPSPKEWGYRTKITPHFDSMPKWLTKGIAANDPDVKQTEDGTWEGMVDFVHRKVKGKGKGKGKAGASFGLLQKEEDAMNVGGPEGTEGKEEGGAVEPKHGEVIGKVKKTYKLNIGYNAAASRGGTLDIEECPIATPILNASLVHERKKVQDTIETYARGATLLLRDSLPTPSPADLTPFDPATPLVPASSHVTITNHKLPVYERVGDYLFTFTAGSFFQNNNSILVPLTTYVRDAIFPPGVPDEKKPTHLVDTYCGSGLFGITLASGFEKVAGVEIDPQAVVAARKNAEINGLGRKTTWLCGEAENIFGKLPEAGFAGGHSCVVIDPPRKGCDMVFLQQLLEFKPLTIVYVSCNVHTQARDVGWFLQVGKAAGVDYTLESLRGFDLFPQTAHVESVAVLRLNTAAQGNEA